MASPQSRGSETYLTEQAVEHTKEVHVAQDEVATGEHVEAADERRGDHVGRTKKHVPLKWWQAAIIMTAATNSLGVLSLPKAISPLGLIPAALLILILGVTNWVTGYLIFEVMRSYPHVRSFPELMGVFLGSWGRTIGGYMQAFLLVFIMSAHLVGFSTMLQVITDKDICTISCIFVGMAVMGVWAVPRGMRETWWLGLAACISVLSSVAVAIASMVAEHTAASDVALTAYMGQWQHVVPECAQALNSILFVFLAHVAYPTIISEMEDREDFPLALMIQSLATICFATLVGLVIYTIVGSSVQSPALSSAGPLMSRVAWGLAIPTIAVAAVVSCSIAAQHIYNGVWSKNGKPHVTQEKTLQARASWYFINFVLWSGAVVLALAVPAFHQMVPLIGAIFGPIYCLILPPYFWFRQQGRLHQVGLLRVIWLRPGVGIYILSIPIYGILHFCFGVLGSAFDSRNAIHEGLDPKPFSCDFRH